MPENIIKSRKRVADHGEVFTPSHIVNDMLDLVRQETQRIDSRFLEPACGNGNFLAEILTRKLEVAKKTYKKAPTEYEKFSLLALSSIYGIDILEDNAGECRERLYNIWDKAYKSVCKRELNDEARETARHLLHKNIVCGDALTLKTSAGEPIVFTEWSLIGDKIKSRDFEFGEMINASSNDKQTGMFIEYDEQAGGFIPRPCGEDQPIYYRELGRKKESEAEYGTATESI